MRIAVVGGGWAGLSAAVTLRQAGSEPTVFEAAPTLGGRARNVHSRRLDLPIDNGQHLLLGACTATLELVRTLNPAADTAFTRRPLAVASADGRFRLAAADLPAPWHLLAALLGARGLTLSERLELVRLRGSLASAHALPPPDWTVTQWLRHSRQPTGLAERLWHPLCLAALNTPADQASARLFARMLRDCLTGPATAGDMLVPRLGLSDLWVAHLPASMDIRPSTPVRHVGADNARPLIDGEGFDGVILACPPAAAARLLRDLPETPGARAYLDTLEAFTYLPIATLTLELTRPWHLPYPMLMLDAAPAHGAFGQWLFSHADSARSGREQACVTVVVSDARDLLSHPRQDVIDGMIRQVRDQTRCLGAMPGTAGHDLIIEKRATFAATPGLSRPANRTPWPHVWTAGDWTDTGYPAVLEGAVRSGRAAALEALG